MAGPGGAARIRPHRGHVFTDRLAPLRKTLVRNKLNAMAKGKYEAAYRTKQTKK
jgi:hypothetical protein